MGVRDYLDKNQDLNRETFLNAVRRQLERIVPAKRQRQFTRSLYTFREAEPHRSPREFSSFAMLLRMEPRSFSLTAMTARCSTLRQFRSRGRWLQRWSACRSRA
jgi:hypothetical protein